MDLYILLNYGNWTENLNLRGRVLKKSVVLGIVRQK